MTTDTRLYTTVVKRIMRMIESGQFPPGSRLPGERDLATQLSVSRLTVREAQIALQAKGVIEVRTGSGAKVLPPQTPKDELPKVEAFELTQARTLFESEAAALAATTITDNDLAQLDDLVEAMGQDGGASPVHQDVDREFHMTIARSTGNPAVIDTIERLWRMRNEIPEISDAYGAICDISPQDRIAEHKAIVDALRARDAGAARAAMRRHFACIMEAMMSTAEERAIEAARQRTMETRRRFLDMPAGEAMGGQAN